MSVWILSIDGSIEIKISKLLIFLMKTKQWRSNKSSILAQFSHDQSSKSTTSWRLALICKSRTTDLLLCFPRNLVRSGIFARKWVRPHFAWDKRWATSFNLSLSLSPSFSVGFPPCFLLRQLERAAAEAAAGSVVVSFPLRKGIWFRMRTPGSYTLASTKSIER